MMIRNLVLLFLLSSEVWPFQMQHEACYGCISSLVSTYEMGNVNRHGYSWTYMPVSKILCYSKLYSQIFTRSVITVRNTLLFNTHKQYWYSLGWLRSEEYVQWEAYTQSKFSTQEYTLFVIATRPLLEQFIMFSIIFQYVRTTWRK